MAEMWKKLLESWSYLKNRATFFIELSKFQNATLCGKPM